MVVVFGSVRAGINVAKYLLSWIDQYTIHFLPIYEVREIFCFLQIDKVQTWGVCWDMNKQVDWLWSAMSFSSSCNETFSFSNFEWCLEMQRFYLPLFIPFHSVAFSEERKPFIRFSLRGKCLLHWTCEKLFYSWFCGSVCMFLYIRSHSDTIGLGTHTEFCVIIFILLFTFLLHCGLTNPLSWFQKVISAVLYFPNDLTEPSLILK